MEVVHVLVVIVACCILGYLHLRLYVLQSILFATQLVLHVTDDYVNIIDSMKYLFGNSVFVTVALMNESDMDGRNCW